MNQTLPVPLYYPSSSSSFPLSPPFPGDVLSIAYDQVFEASMPRGDGINGYHRENNTGQLDGLGRSAYEGVEQKYIQTEVENYRFPTPPATSTRDPLHTFSHQSYLPNPRFDNATYHSAPYPQKSEASAFLDLDLSQPGPSIYRYAETSSAPSMPEELVKIEDAEEAGPDDGDNEEPLYVNAKQYHRILKRRLARQRLEELNRLSRSSKPYLHESRHRHACSRPRGKGGRFLTADEIETLKRDESAKAGMTEREGTIESRLSTSDRSA